MPVNITETATFDATIQTVGDGEPANQADFALAPQGLANRTRYLHEKGNVRSSAKYAHVDNDPTVQHLAITSNNVWTTIGSTINVTAKAGDRIAIFGSFTAHMGSIAAGSGKGMAARVQGQGLLVSSFTVPGANARMASTNDGTTDDGTRHFCLMGTYDVASDDTYTFSLQGNLPDNNGGTAAMNVMRNGHLFAMVVKPDQA
jgi:hypothetical protein